MLVVSSAEFRANQKAYLDKVDEGAEILIQRGKDKAYRVTPITENDTVVPKDYILKPDAELARAITFEELLVDVKSDLKRIFQERKK